MHVPSHTLTLAFKHTEPCKVLLSAEERSLAFFAVSLSRANVQQRLSLASSPMRQTDAQRGREGRARDADGQRTEGKTGLKRAYVNRTMRKTTHLLQPQRDQTCSLT